MSRLILTRFAALGCLLAMGAAMPVDSSAQPPRPGGQRGGSGGGGPRPGDLGSSKLNLGEPGIAWYTTWESAAEEAKRSGRAIMFVAAATQCRGISGVF
ncbi:MAG: hypothetical protein ACR2NZ_15395 [Rubripirellula sp.]